MFLFECCNSASEKQVYRLRDRTTNQLRTITESKLNQTKDVAMSTQLYKVHTSEYQDLVKSYKGKKDKWEDMEFHHNYISLGEIEGIDARAVEWKRLSNLVQNPVLYDGVIEPKDSIQGAMGDCYFLSAVSALSEQDRRIKNVFGQASYNPNGIYVATMRIDGVIRQILFDDYVPVSKEGKPLFCQPHKNEIWVPLLEKAWAKANGSYAKIISGTPSEIFRAFTFAPASSVLTGRSKEEHERLWRVILANSVKNRPCCCGTHNNPNVYWQGLGLVPAHAYTLIDATELDDRKGKTHRVLKLRNPWGKTQWDGDACQTDKQFWASIVSLDRKLKFLKGNNISNDGVFYMTFRDYCIYFGETHICQMEETGNYLYETFSPGVKRGTMWSLVVSREDDYAIELHQESIRKSQEEYESLSRATLYVVKKEEKGYEFIGGAMTYYQQHASAKIRLTPGQYIIFSKLDPAESDSQVPENASVSVYSLEYATLKSTPRISTSSILRECFLSHGRLNKRKRFQDDTMWISWKLLFLEGGYAYIAFGCVKGAKHKWSVTFNQSDFNEGNFKLKKPFKGKGDGQSFEVHPGGEEVIVARVVNKAVRDLVFPPKLSWKIEVL